MSYCDASTARPYSRTAAAGLDKPCRISAFKAHFEAARHCYESPKCRILDNYDERVRTT